MSLKKLFLFFLIFLLLISIANAFTSSASNSLGQNIYAISQTTFLSGNRTDINNNTMQFAITSQPVGEVNLGNIMIYSVFSPYYTQPNNTYSSGPGGGGGGGGGSITPVYYEIIPNNFTLNMMRGEYKTISLTLYNRMTTDLGVKITTDLSLINTLSEFKITREGNKSISFQLIGLDKNFNKTINLTLNVLGTEYVETIPIRINIVSIKLEGEECISDDECETGNCAKLQDGRSICRPLGVKDELGSTDTIGDKITAFIKDNYVILIMVLALIVVIIGIFVVNDINQKWKNLTKEKKS